MHLGFYSGEAGSPLSKGEMQTSPSSLWGHSSCSVANALFVTSHSSLVPPDHRVPECPGVSQECQGEFVPQGFQGKLKMRA